MKTDTRAAPCWRLTSNSSYDPPITAETLCGILEGRLAPGAWMTHLRAFFRDQDPVVVDRFLRMHGISWEAAKKCYVEFIREFDARPEMDDYFLA